MTARATRSNSTSPAWINSHLKDLANAEGKIRTIRYEEEIIVDFDEEKTKVLTEYASLIRQVEGILLNSKTYGLKEDDRYEKRRKALKDFYEYMFMNPLLASRTLEDYKEPLPEKQVFRRWVQHVPRMDERHPEELQGIEALQARRADRRPQAGVPLAAGLRSLQFIQRHPAHPAAGREIHREPGQRVRPRVRDKGEDLLAPVAARRTLYILENPIIENLPRELGSCCATRLSTA